MQPKMPMAIFTAWHVAFCVYVFAPSTGSIGVKVKLVKPRLFWLSFHGLEAIELPARTRPMAVLVVLSTKVNSVFAEPSVSLRTGPDMNTCLPLGGTLKAWSSSVLPSSMWVRMGLILWYPRDIVSMAFPKASVSMGSLSTPLMMLPSTSNWTPFTGQFEGVGSPVPL